GSLDEAIGRAAFANSHDKLPMDLHEKMNTAWRLSITTALSKALIAKMANVSPRSVANMRDLKRQLECRYTADELCELGWYRAQRAALGHLVDDVAAGEARRDEAAEKLAQRIHRHFGALLKRINPSIVARALWLYS